MSLESRDFSDSVVEGREDIRIRAREHRPRSKIS